MNTKVMLLLTAAAVTAASVIYVLQPQPETTTASNTAAATPNVTDTPLPAHSQTGSSSDSGSGLQPQPAQLSPAQLSTEMAKANNTTLNDLCQQSTDAAQTRCTLRYDIDLSHAFAASPTELNGNKITQALTSTNFEQLHQLLTQANTSQEALLRQAEYQAAFNEFYQYAPGLLSNVVSCSDEICAASFTVADANSANQIFSATEKFTQHINVHSFRTLGLDNANNMQVKLIFSNSAAFETVVH